MGTFDCHPGRAGECQETMRYLHGLPDYVCRSFLNHRYCCSFAGNLIAYFPAVRERERERDRETERDRDRDRDRGTERDRERQRERWQVQWTLTRNMHIVNSALLHIV